MKKIALLAALAAAAPAIAGCPAQGTPAPPPYPGPAPYPAQPYPGQPYPAQPYPGQPYPAQPYPAQPTAQPVQPVQPAQRPLLPPLIGVAAWQAELRSVIAEDLAALPANQQALVRGIPIVFDPTPEVNAYAGCDDNGAPFLAATAGILEAVDAIAQTKATDELFGTQTYDAYCNQVLPQIVQSPQAHAGLPAGIVPANLGPDPRRWSRAHEMFDEILAFTFGHEMGHHYLGHTGCANGQPLGAGPDPTQLGRIAIRVPLFNQVAEAAADTVGTNNALDAGRARRPQYEWNEAGALTLLDYFARLEKAAGVGGLAGLLSPVRVLQTHPAPLLRIPLVQATARTWHLQHPG